jgi:hypothetical protein
MPGKEQQACTGMSGAEKVRKKKEANKTARWKGRKNGKIRR